MPQPGEVPEPPQQERQQIPLDFLSGEKLMELKNAEDRNRIENAFVYHAPMGDQVDRYGKIRAKAKELAELLIECCPYSQERSTAIASLRQSVHWANAAIACNEKVGPAPTALKPMN